MMHYSKMFGGAALLAALVLAGCESDPGSDLVTSPDNGQTPATIDALKGHSSAGEGAYGKGSAAVYTLSNAASGNSVLRFVGAADGSLNADGSYPTGGAGTGAGLGSQGALVKQGALLFAVNAGSNEISVLRVNGNGLTVVSSVSSGGTMPISLTVKGDILYVLNAGEPGNITGFRGAHTGHLRPLPGSTQPLSGTGVAPAQIQFSPTRRVLVVTEKASNKIVTYKVDFAGRAQSPFVQNSVGDTPYGFDFTPRGYLVVSDAYGGNPLASALSSYRLGREGTIDLVTGPVADMQTAACWVVISRDGRFAYTTNTGTNNISAYRINRRGDLMLFQDGGNTASTDPGPIDVALSRSSRFLYCLNAGGNSITSYLRDPRHGTLSPLGKVAGLPSGAAGLVAE